MKSFPIKLLRFIILVMIGCLINACGNSDATQEEEKAKINSEQKANIEQKEESLMKDDTKELEILPTIQSKSAAQNQIWVGTFQIVWNDLMDNITRGPVTFLEGDTPAMAEELNKRSFTKDALSENAYYTKWGEALPALKEEIEQAIKSKFGENSEVLEGLDWNVEPDVKKYVLYAMLKKDFQFVKKLDDKGKSLFRGSEQEVSYFGADGDPSIGIQFYNNEDDFAVTLKTNQGDLVHLYRTNLQGKTLAELYTQMKQEAQSYTGNHDFEETDLFKAPKLDFKSRCEFSELYDKPIQNPDSPDGTKIGKAIETVELEMDEAGAKIKSEAVITENTGGFPDLIAVKERPSWRYFYVTGPYALFIEEPGKQPYFAMYITDVAKLQSAGAKE
ncbi:MAG: hypothetical protein IKP96_00290 [Elusimicrobiaceae bacterium]|nr:hypothetical protein [Elusimicrobiaceae bacterium]